jgi:hypothetical protein
MRRAVTDLPTIRSESLGFPRSRALLVGDLSGSGLTNSQKRCDALIRIAVAPMAAKPAWPPVSACSQGAKLGSERRGSAVITTDELCNGFIVL